MPEQAAPLMREGAIRYHEVRLSLEAAVHALYVAEALIGQDRRATTDSDCAEFEKADAIDRIAVEAKRSISKVIPTARDLENQERRRKRTQWH